MVSVSRLAAVSPPHETERLELRGAGPSACYTQAYIGLCSCNSCSRHSHAKLRLSSRERTISIHIS